MVDQSVPDLFEGQPPPSRDEYVLGQGFYCDPQYCRRLIPDARMWPAELDGVDTDRRGWLWIDRALLFTIAERTAVGRSDEWAATQLHAAIAFWGARAGQSRSRATKPFADPNVAVRLGAAINLVRGEGAVSAYKALSRYQKLWVRGLGPSYFTKLMYFAGYDAKPYLSRPLIMDDNVIDGLKIVTQGPWEATLADYVRYLDLAKDWAFELGTTPDVVERRLFAIGS